MLIYSIDFKAFQPKAEIPRTPESKHFASSNNVTPQRVLLASTKKEPSLQKSVLKKRFMEKQFEVHQSHQVTNKIRKERVAPANLPLFPKETRNTREQPVTPETETENMSRTPMSKIIDQGNCQIFRFLF